MAESEEELKSLLMKEKEQSEKDGLKLNIQKTKIMASGPITSWESSLSLSFFFSLAIPQFGLLSHVSSLRLSSGHSGLAVTLSMQPAPPCSAPACWCG